MYILPGALAPLAQYRQFIVVRFAPRAGSPGKMDKFPVNIGTMRDHDAHDPAIWMPCPEAAVHAERLGPSYGVGFTLTANDPFICFDLDDCTTLSGAWIPEVADMLREFPGAVELSNSGKGLHSWNFYRGPAPEHGCKSTGTLNKKWLELYTEKRFFAFGGNCTGAMQDVTDILPGFIQRWFPVRELSADTEGWTTAPVAEHTPMSDDELIARACAQTRRQDAASVFSGAAPLPNFVDLWTRNVEQLALCFPPQTAGKEFDGSDADFALAKELAYWTGKDCQRIERLMTASALARDKYAERRRDKTYLQETILNGVAGCMAVYHVKPLIPEALAATGPARLLPKAVDYQTFIGREDMAVLFAGCVYVQDLNMVLLPNGDIVDQARFKARYRGYTFAMDNDNAKVSKDAWDAFINNQVITFPSVEGTCFEPGHAFQDVVERGGREWVNVFKEPPVVRRPGDVGPFMKLLKKLFPNGDDATILLSYMAACVQHRGTKFKWAPFIQGTQGNGKSTLVRCLRYALGDKYIITVKAHMIVNGFNAWMENNVLYVADDFYTGSDRDDLLEALKSLITEDSQAVTLKGIDSMEKSVCGNFMFTDNHKDAQRKRDESRRTCTLYCAQQSKRDRVRDGLTGEFFAKEMYPWLQREGYAYVAELLHTMEIDPRYNPAGDCQEAPDTSVTAEAIIDGRTGVEHEVDEWITLGEPGFCGDFVSYHELKKRLEATPRYAKSASPLKIKEVLGRLGFEMHRGLPAGRVPVEVAPDGMRAILYVRSDSSMATLTDPEQIGQIYSRLQQAAITAAISRRFTQGVVT